MKSSLHCHDSSFKYSYQYRNWHNDSPEHVAFMKEELRGLLAPLLPVPDAQAVLDIGCGMGFALLALRDIGFSNLLGVDMDAEQVLSARKFNLNIIQVEDTIEFLQKHPEQFDIVIMMDVLEHVPVGEQICMMRAVNGALRANGRVLLQVPNAGSIMAAWQRNIDFTHCSTFTPTSLMFVLNNAGFDRIDIPCLRRSRRPSLQLWDRNVRHGLRKWIVEWVWRQVMQVYLGHWVDVARLPVELDMRAIAFKP